MRTNNTDFVSADDFSERLNMSIFTNLEKSHNSESLAKEFGEGFLIIEKSIIDSFIQEVYRETGGEIVKGKFNDTPEINEIQQNAVKSLQELVKVNYKDKSGTREVFIMKAKSDTFEKGKDSEELEKGKLGDAFEYSSLVKFNKTGKEIKEKMAGQVAIHESQISIIESQIEACLKGINAVPTEKQWSYGRHKMIKCPYLTFHYALTDYYEGRNMNQPYECCGGGSVYPTATLEEAKPYKDYNDLVRDWCDNQSELQLIRLFENNFEDSTKYELTAEQMLALGF